MDAGQVSKGGHVAGLCSNGEGMDPQRWRAAEDLVVLGDVTISGAGQSIRKQHVNVVSSCRMHSSRRMHSSNKRNNSQQKNTPYQYGWHWQGHRHGSADVEVLVRRMRG